MNAIDQKPFVTIGWQLVLTMFTAVVLFFFSGWVTAYSALAGGMISTISNAFFAVRLFSNKGSWKVDHLAAVTYRGVIGKIFLTIALFILAVVLIKPLNPAAFFAVYLWIQVSPALIAGVPNKA